MSEGRARATTVTVFAQVMAAAGSVDRAREACLSIVDEVLREDGCLTYHVLQGADDPGTFAWFEQWRDEDAFQAHLSSPHAARLGAALEGHLDRPMVLARYDSLL